VGPSDETLIALVVADDDREAFAVLVNRHQDKIRALLRHLCAGDEGRADDLAQEVLLRWYRGLGAYRAEASLATWLARITYNLFVSDCARRHSQERVHTRLAREQEQVSSAPAGSTLVEARHDIVHALAVLGPAERLMLSLCYGQGLSHAEIAQVLGLPLGTVKTRLRRSLHLMSAALHPGVADDTEEQAT
jgi:RNA polymerase sigma-70 factor (ECF subfamily)